MASLSSMEPANRQREAGQREEGQREDNVRQRSGWLLPIVVFILTAGLSALFLVYYLAPSPAGLIQARPSPTARTEPVQVEIGGLSLHIPANYFVFASGRKGGRQREIALFALLPDLRGYNQADAQVFADHSADSPVLNLLIREETLNLPEQARLSRIYLGYVTDPAGQPGPFGLTQYAFRDDNGYRGEDLFAARSGAETVVMRCWRFAADDTNPDCLRDTQLTRAVTLSYRFKRANLAQWRQIDADVRAMLSRFGAKL